MEAVSETVIRANEGLAFEDGPDHGRVLIFGRDTGGHHSLMEYSVAARDAADHADSPDFGAHRHHDIEETFLVRSGTLRFLLGEDEFDLTEGDLVRVPPGTRHGYANLSGKPVDLLVTFHPGGFEELFVTHRSDQSPPPRPNGFVEDAQRLFASEFEDATTT
jgi:mannose-6-phosphate isomerase-like protein (cupin superfamily)